MAHESAKTYQVNKCLPKQVTWRKLALLNSNGVSDCYYHMADVGLWVEYKTDANLNRKVNLSKLQADWLVRTSGWAIMLTPKGHGVYKTEHEWTTKSPCAVLNTYKEVAQYITNFLEEKNYEKNPMQDGGLQ